MVKISILDYVAKNSLFKIFVLKYLDTGIVIAEEGWRKIESCWQEMVDLKTPEKDIHACMTKFSSDCARFLVPAQYNRDGLVEYITWRIKEYERAIQEREEFIGNEGLISARGGIYALRCLLSKITDGDFDIVAVRAEEPASDNSCR